MNIKKKTKFENPYFPFNKIENDLTMKKEISKKYIFPHFFSTFVSVFGTTPPPIRNAPPPPPVSIDGVFLMVFLVLALVFGIYKLNLNSVNK